MQIFTNYKSLVSFYFCAKQNITKTKIEKKSLEVNLYCKNIIHQILVANKFQLFDQLHESIKSTCSSCF
ncbi:hypothetical protein HanIR_Chr17g0858021 [Helianthus annuus]|nr:hypothetical protein HanIR_Chr17g0858021 [Helianthus annuus]